MPFGPLYTDLPLASATATRPATRYVDENSWNTLVGNFSLWGDSVNANGKNLSNVVLTGTTGMTGDLTLVNGLFSVTLPALGSTVASTQTAVSLAASEVNVDFCRLRRERITAGTGWATEKWVLERHVDVTPMGYVSFVDTGVAIGSAATEVARFLATGRVGIGTATPAALLHLDGGTGAAGVDVITGLLLDRAYGSVGDSMDIVYGAGTGMTGSRTGRISMQAVAGGEAGFIFYAQTGAADGYANEIFRIQGNGTVKMKIGGTLKTITVDGSGFVKAA